jgi:hypothetical protein
MQYVGGAWLCTGGAGGVLCGCGALPFYLKRRKSADGVGMKRYMKSPILLFGATFALCVAVVVGIYMWSLHTDECIVSETIQTPNGIVQIVNDECKEALPHTTDKNTIRMTKKVWAGSRRNDVLFHERVHLEQKRATQDWKEFYRRYWEYDISAKPPSDLPHKFIEHLRPNPDTKAEPWALWRRRYLFFPNYANAAAPSLKNIRVQVWDTQEKHLVPVPEEWKTLFCHEDSCPYQFEHPHEISAELLTHDNHSSASARLQNWWNANKYVSRTP